jgi:hypothetical protein
MSIPREAEGDPRKSWAAIFGMGRLTFHSSAELLELLPNGARAHGVADDDPEQQRRGNVDDVLKRHSSTG